MDPALQAKLEKANDLGNDYAGLISVVGLAATLFLLLRRRKA